MLMITDSDSDLEHLIGFVKVNYGIDLSKKTTFVEVRLQKYMARHNFTTYPAFFSYLSSDSSGEAMAEFISSLLVNYTSFYRESMHFEYLSQVILPQLSVRLQEDKTIYSWSAGCSTGEEPYTLAMIFRDFFNVRKDEWDTTILATDISSYSLEKAKEGRYPIESVAELSPLWLSSYFTRDSGHTGQLQVSPLIRSDVEFRSHNLVGTDFNFKHKFHFIFCRNVMIYFNDSTKNKLIQFFYNLLEDGGYLFIGMSERLDHSTPFVYVKPSIYRKVVSTCAKN